MPPPFATRDTSTSVSSVSQGPSLRLKYPICNYIKNRGIYTPCVFARVPSASAEKMRFWTYISRRLRELRDSRNADVSLGGLKINVHNSRDDQKIQGGRQDKAQFGKTSSCYQRMP